MKIKYFGQLVKIINIVCLIPWYPTRGNPYRHHYIQELLRSAAITVEQVSSSDNLADIFTKSLPRDHHHRLLTALNIN